MSEIVKPKNKYARGPQTRISADSVIDRFPDIKAERDRALKSAGCCDKNGIIAKYEVMAKTRAGRG